MLLWTYCKIALSFMFVGDSDMIRQIRQNEVILFCCIQKIKTVALNIK